MSRYASMKSAAKDGRFLTLAFKDERTNAKAQQSEREISKPNPGRFVTLAFRDERTNAKAQQSEREISNRTTRRPRLKT